MRATLARAKWRSRTPILHHSLTPASEKNLALAVLDERSSGENRDFKGRHFGVRRKLLSYTDLAMLDRLVTGEPYGRTGALNLGI